MATDHFDRVKKLLLRVLALADDERGQFLDVECHDAPHVRAEVERLLAAYDDLPRILASDGPQALLSIVEERTAGPPRKTLDDPSRSEEPPDSIGPYRLLEKLGEGGFGEVYLAEQSDPVRRRVALKILKAGMDTKAVLARFEAERQALALMDHANIARVLDAGETERGRPYFVMDLVKGEPITDYCDRHTLSNRDRLGLVISVCHAVQHAHQKGIIHRDLKPSNILVAVTDGQAVPKVIDFGIAKATTGPLTDKTLFTRQGQMIGTPAYMSPEQAEAGGLDVDTRSDVYSLGVVLYQLLAGALPFDPRTLQIKGYAEIQRILREEDPPRPSTRVSTAGEGSAEIAKRRGTDAPRLTKQLRGELDWIVLKAMEKDRTRRYETASALALDIGRYLKDEAVLAGPPSAAYRFRKFAKRHRVGMIVAAAMMVLVNGALIQSNVQRARVEAARDESEAVRRFLAGMLASVDPGVQGREITVREVLDEAAKAIDDDFADQPLIEASLRSTIGSTYRSLGLYDAAEANLKSAVEIRRKHLGEKHRQTIASMNDLAVLYRKRGRYDEAAPLFLQTLEARRRILGAEHPETLHSMNNLANLYSDQGRHQKAESLYVSVLAIQRRVLGEEHRRTMTSTGNLATLYYAQGRYEEAEPLYLAALEARRRVLGEEHPATLNSMVNLGQLYATQARREEAEPIFLETLEISRRTLGEEHPETLRHMQSLASLYLDQGKHAQAEPLFLTVLEIQRRVVGEEHRETLITMMNLGNLYKDSGRYEEAESLSVETLEAQSRVLGEEHPYTFISMNNLGEVYLAQGRYAEAEPLFARALETSGRVLAADHPYTQVFRYNLGRLWGVLGNAEKAKHYLRQALDHGYSDEAMFDDPDLAALRGDPEFEAIVAEVKRRNAGAAEGGE